MLGSKLNTSYLLSQLTFMEALYGRNKNYFKFSGEEIKFNKSDVGM